MSYSAFTLRKAKEELNLNFVEGVRFLPNLDLITPSTNLIPTGKHSFGDRNGIRKSAIGINYFADSI
jgi:hypothetical protein